MYSILCTSARQRAQTRDAPLLSGHHVRRARCRRRRRRCRPTDERGERGRAVRAGEEGLDRGAREKARARPAARAARDAYLRRRGAVPARHGRAQRREHRARLRRVPEERRAEEAARGRGRGPPVQRQLAHLRQARLNEPQALDAAADGDASGAEYALPATVLLAGGTRPPEISPAQAKKNRDREYQRRKRAQQSARVSETPGLSEDEGPRRKRGRYDD